MAYASPPDPSSYGTASATPSPSGPRSPYRQQRQSGIGPGQSGLEKWDDFKDTLPDPSEETVEQREEMRAQKARLSDPPHGRLKEPKEDTSDPEVLYLITCRDSKDRRFEVYADSENPFEELVLLDLENSQTTIIIEIFIEAQGVGSPEWLSRVYPKFPRAGNFAADRTDNRRASKYRYSPSPPPLSRVDTFPDSNSDVSGDDGDDFLEEDRFEDPDRSRTFRGNERPRLSLTEVLNKGVFRASVVTWKEIHIFSRNLLRLLRSVVRHYPGQNLKGEKIIVTSPFEMLAHYYNDLNALQNRALDILAKTSHDGPDDAEQPEAREQADLLDQATVDDLNVLLHAFKRHYVKNFAPEEARHKVGFASYGLIWFLFRPGVDVYARVGGKLAGLVFERCEKRGQRLRAGAYVREDDRVGGSSYWVVHCWSLTYNDRRIVKTFHEIFVDKFRGERSITSLPVFPCSYLDNLDGGKTRARLQDLGEKYYNIIRRSPAHLKYCGMTWDLERGQRESSQTLQSRKPDIVNTVYPFENLTDTDRNTPAR